MRPEEEVIFRAVSIEAVLADKRAAISGDVRQKMEIQLEELVWVLEDGKII